MINGGTKLLDAVYVDNAVHAHTLAIDQLRAQVRQHRQGVPVMRGNQHMEVKMLYVLAVTCAGGRVQQA